MKHILATILAAVVCLFSSVSASVLEPETVEELLNASALNFTETNGAWLMSDTRSKTMDEAVRRGVELKDLTYFVRGRGLLVLAQCRVCPKDEKGDGDTGEDGAKRSRLIILLDPSVAEDLVVVKITPEGQWKYECWHFVKNVEAVDPFTRRGVDCVEFFPE